jgi:YggT family protein
MNYIRFNIMNVEKTSPVILRTFRHIKNNIEILDPTYALIVRQIKNNFLTLLRIFHEIFLKLLGIFQLFLTLRMLMTWFPNYNLRRRPFVFIAKLTRTYLGIFANSCPKFFGVDLSAILSFVWLRSLIRICS